MDELSLLEADAIESALPPRQAPDFTGSLDYIDSLASRRALTLSLRDAAAITMAVNYRPSSLSLDVGQAMQGPTDVGYSSVSDFRPLGDARRFDPEFSVRAPRALVRSASRVVSSRPVAHFPPGWRNPLDPDRSTEELNRVIGEIERRVHRKPFKNYFDRPNQVVICLKRKIRREVMNAFGYAGETGFNPPKRTYWSRIIC